MELAIIETPGPKGRKEGGLKRSQIVGIIVFSNSFQYLTRENWRADRKKHLVDEQDSQFGFQDDKPKWGWKVRHVESLLSPTSPPKKRGIVFALNCKI